MENIIGDDFPPAEMITESAPPTALSMEMLSTPAATSNVSPSDGSREEYYPSPVSSTGLDWELSQQGSDHESSADFEMSEHSEESFSNGESP